MPTADSEIKCALSEAYLKVVSSVTQFPVQITGRSFDIQKIDGLFTINRDFGPTAKRNLFTLYLQLKATSQDLKWKRGKCRFEIEAELYDLFRTTKTSEPMYLVVLLLPKKHEKCKWVTCTVSALTIKGCAYWVSLYGAPEPKGSSKVTVTIRRKNMVTVESLNRLINEFAINETLVQYES